jgi:hypothetical protein
MRLSAVMSCIAADVVAVGIKILCGLLAHAYDFQVSPAAALSTHMRYGRS